MTNEELIQLKKEKVFLIRKRKYVLDNYMRIFCSIYKERLQDVDKRLEQIDLMLADPSHEMIAKFMRKAEAQLNKVAPCRK